MEGNLFGVISKDIKYLERDMIDQTALTKIPDNISRGIHAFQIKFLLETLWKSKDVNHKLVHLKHRL